MRHRTRKFAALAGGTLLSTCLVVSTATPASAFSGGVATNCGYLGQQICDGVGQIVPVGTGSGPIVFTCHAVTPFAVQATGVGCFVRGIFTGNEFPAPTVFTQGQQSSTTITYPGVLNEPYELCIGAGIVDLGGTPRGVTNYRCFFAL